MSSTLEPGEILAAWHELCAGRMPSSTRGAVQFAFLVVALLLHAPDAYQEGEDVGRVVIQIGQPATSDDDRDVVQEGEPREERKKDPKQPRRRIVGAGNITLPLPRIDGTGAQG